MATIGGGGDISVSNNAALTVGSITAAEGANVSLLTYGANITLGGNITGTGDTYLGSISVGTGGATPAVPVE